MKKRVALLLAAAMALSMLPVNVFAATNNYVDNRLTVPDASAIVEHRTDRIASQYLIPAQDNWGGDPDWYVDGTDLVVPLQRDVKDGYQFKLTLTNAKWFFRNNSANVTTDSDFPTLAETGGTEFATYDTSKGDLFSIYEYDRLTRGALTKIAGVEYEEAVYSLEVSRLNDNVATITVKDNYAGNYVFRIPLVTYISDSNVEATVSIDPGNSSTVTSQKVVFANTADGKTNSTAKDVVTARDVFDLDTFVVSELRVGSIRSGNYETGEIIKLSLPYGYHFTDNLSTLKVGLESGLAWGDGSTGYGIQNSSNSTGKNYYPVFAEGYEYNDKLSGSLSSNDSYDELWIFLGAITPSTQLRGSVYIEGLQIWADDDAAVPAAGKEIEIKMHVDGEHNITEQDVLVAKRVDWLLGLKTLTTVPTLVSGRYIGPSWDGTDADDNTHKTARVQLYESAANSWWGSRTTVLALPATDNNTVKGAKFRRVEVHDRDHISTSQDIKDTRFVSALYSSSSNTQKTTTNVPTDEGVYLNDGEKHGAITVNDNKITISNISLNGKDKAWINFDLWVSVEYGFGKQSGDLKLSIDPSSTSITGAAAAELPSVVIAHIVDPITVSANVSDVKIGYQYQTTSDIQIKENGAGYLLKNKTVKVSITDLISSDLFFTNDTKIQVTAGDLKINNIYATGQGGFTSQSRSWLEATSGTGTLSFDIERASTTASTVTISNVAVKLDRTVPVTNKNSYQAVVWGTAVAENYGLIDDSGRTWKADFNTVGEFLPYINVISSADDASSILTQEVRVTIGESFYVVNGKTYSMDAVAYISTASNSTMVPLRFVANAFGLRDDQILWDDSTKTATILAPNRTLQFTLNKSTMLVNGTAVTMVSPDGKAVVAEIKTINGLGRMYLPFRALGNAFGIPVDWEADTNTAIYNKGANANGTSSVTNVTPVAS